MGGNDIVVTGAGGWLGRALVRAAVAAGVGVRGVVRSDEGARRVASDGGRAVRVDDLDPAALADESRGCAALVQLVGIGAERDGATFEQVNVGGMQRAIAAARLAGIPRIVYLSGLGVAHYGQSRRCTNAYFLSKLVAEVELFRSGLEAVVFRPSYVIGPEDELIPALLHELASGTVEIVGDGRYRMQPVSVDDVCASVLAGTGVALPGPSAFDLVGPEPVSYCDFVERVTAAAARAGRPSTHSVLSRPVEEADQRAAAGGYRGLLPDELDVLLCDETADPAGIERLLGRALRPLDETLDEAVRGSLPRMSESFRRR